MFSCNKFPTILQIFNIINFLRYENADKIKQALNKPDTLSTLNQTLQDNFNSSVTSVNTNPDTKLDVDIIVDASAARKNLNKAHSEVQTEFTKLGYGNIVANGKIYILIFNYVEFVNLFIFLMCSLSVKKILCLFWKRLRK